MKRTLIAATVTATVVTACGTAPNDSPPDAGAFAAAVSAQMMPNYGDLTPAELWGIADVVAVGEVVAVTEGRTTSSGGISKHHVTVILEPTTTVGRNKGEDTDPVQIEFPTPENVEANFFAERLPEGTELAFAASDATEPGDRVVEAPPAESPIYYRTHPLGWLGMIDGTLSSLADPQQSLTQVEGWESVDTPAEWLQAMTRASETTPLGSAD